MEEPRDASNTRQRAKFSGTRGASAATSSTGNSAQETIGAGASIARSRTSAIPRPRTDGPQLTAPDNDVRTRDADDGTVDLSAINGRCWLREPAVRLKRCSPSTQLSKLQKQKSINSRLGFSFLIRAQCSGTNTRQRNDHPPRHRPKFLLLLKSPAMIII